MRLNFKIEPLIIFICFFLTAPILPQSVGDTINYFFESSAVTSSGGNAPFWFVSNNFGTISLKSPSISVRTGLNGNIDLNRSLRLLYGIDIVDRHSNKNEIFIQQAYVSLKLGFITLKAGSWEEKLGNQDNSLSSGGIIWSGNAKPISQVGIFIPDYTPVPFSHGFVEFKGGIFHGWLGDNQYVNNEWLHHKYLYLRTHLTGHFQFEYGLQHFAEWGGISSEYGKLPNDFNSFIKVFFSKGGDDSAPLGESINAIGNHIGSHCLAIYYSDQKTSIKFYFQNIFEDRSGFELNNFPDGLWGITFSSENWKHVSKVLVEFINTTNQSGTFNHYYIDGVYHSSHGNDNYFNHEIYREGWTNKGKTIGSPLITSPGFVPSSTSEYLINTKLKAFHVGLEGREGIISYKALYTYSSNYGTNVNPFPKRKDQHSLLLKSTFTSLLPWDISMSVAVAADLGELFENNAGIMLSFRKEGFVKWKSKNDN